MPEVEEEEESPFRDSVVKWVRDVASSICNFGARKINNDNGEIQCNETAFIIGSSLVFLATSHNLVESCTTG